MVHPCWRWLPPSLALLLVTGCLYPVRDKVDHVVCDLAAVPRDVEPRRPDDPAKTMPPASGSEAKAGKPQGTETDATLTRMSAQQPAGRQFPSILTRLQVPANLPGANAKPIELPPYTPENKAKRDRIIAELYPPLEALGPNVKPAPGPEGRAVTLSDLQRYALEHNPTLRQAAARVEAARGAAIQAGLPSNPTFGPQADTSGTTGGPGYQGFFFDQVIKLPNKLQLSRAIAAMDLRNAEVALRRAETDRAHQVRGDYFAVLVALESIKVYEALAEFTTSVYDIQLDQLRFGGMATAADPMLLRVGAVSARLGVYQARNQYTNAWKQLAADVGRPDWGPTEVQGRLDIPVPVYDHARVLERVLDRHTDVETARNALLQTNYQLRLAQFAPISDVDLHVVIQKDYTGPPNAIVHSVQMGFTIPLWDRNQGGIIQAQGNVVAASEGEHQARVNLTKQLAQAFAAYENNRIAIKLYRDEILPRQVQGYRALYERFQGEAPRAGNPPQFADVIATQALLAGNIQSYLTAVGALWQSVTDIANLLQTDDLYQIGNDRVPTEDLDPVPDFCQLKPLPCCHPCSTLPDQGHGAADGAWPAAVPNGETKPLPRAKEEAKKLPTPEPAAVNAPRPQPPLELPQPLPGEMPLPRAGETTQPGVGVALPKLPAAELPTELPPVGSLPKPAAARKVPARNVDASLLEPPPPVSAQPVGSKPENH